MWLVRFICFGTSLCLEPVIFGSDWLVLLVGSDLWPTMLGFASALCIALVAPAFALDTPVRRQRKEEKEKAKPAGYAVLTRLYIGGLVLMSF